MPIESWFPTLIMFEYLENIDLKLLADKALKIKKTKNKINNDWLCETYSSSNLLDLSKDKEFKKLIEQIKLKVKEFAKSYGIFNSNIKYQDGWINIAEHNQYQEYHVHPNSHFSVVFYIQTFENCGDIYFASPEKNNMKPLPKENGINAYNAGSCSFKAEQGKLIIFPSNLQHMVRTNLSSKQRISFSANFEVI